MDPDRFQMLLDRYFDEALDAPMTEEFEQLLLASPKARELFWQRAKLHGMLRQIGQENWGLRAASKSKTPLPASVNSMFTNGWFRATVFTVLMTGLIVGLTVYLSSRTTVSDVAPHDAKTNSSEAPSQANAELAITKSKSAVEQEAPNWVAVVRKEFDVEWNDPIDSLIVGETMAPRRIEFDSGLLEIQTDRGVLIIIEGPADLEILSGMEVVCRDGRLRVDVPPPATGFLVKTPQFDVVDRGTSFAIDVDGDDKSEVHVIKGMVEIVPGQDAGEAKRELREGESIGVRAGVTETIASEPASFPSPSKLTKWARMINSQFLTAWKQKQQMIAKDPHCILYFDFEDGPDSPILANKSVNATPGSEGTIVGAHWVQGRWPGKNALEFRNLFDRVLFSMPGEHRSLTCLASIRLDSMASQSAPLLATNSNSSNSEGGFRWEFGPASQPNRAGHMRLRRETDGEWKTVAESPEARHFGHERLQKWIQVAFVWDGEKRVLDQYVGSYRLSSQSLDADPKLSDLLLGLGQMEIGNSNLAGVDSESMSVANLFTGCIDEFAIFDRAFKPQEVYSHHQIRRVSWSGAANQEGWDDLDNWYCSFAPGKANIVYFDHVGDQAAIFTDGCVATFNSLRVGTRLNSTGELVLTGGELIATGSPIYPSRVGVSGGRGRILQQNGSHKFNWLQIGLGSNSVGTYRLEGGELLVMRGSLPDYGSIALGVDGGGGQMEIIGGSLKTRNGVRLGRSEGSGTFAVEGSKPTDIAIGSYGTGDGFWIQESGSKLKVRIDSGGLTTIIVDDVDGKRSSDPYQSGNVTFAEGSILEVDFAGPVRAGAWDVMHWEGKLKDEGLTLSEKVDKDVWSFEFVDTDNSGSPDTLRVIAK